LWVFTVRDEDNFKLIAKKKRSMRWYVQSVTAKGR
jgi:hypothetical protein